MMFVRRVFWALLLPTAVAASWLAVAALVALVVGAVR